MPVHIEDPTIRALAALQDNQFLFSSGSGSQSQGQYMKADSGSNALSLKIGPATAESGGSGTKYRWETYYDKSASTFSNQSEYNYDSIEAAKTAGMAASSADILLVLVRSSEGKVVGSFEVSGQTTTVESGKEQQKQGEGGAAEQGKGGGQVADMGFRYRLIGFKWTWTNRDNENPMYWEGSGAEYEISATGYTYGSSDDALNAGKAVAGSNADVVRVVSESNYPTQFAGGSYTFTDRYTKASNAAAVDKQAAIDEYTKTHHYDPTQGGWVQDKPLPWEAQPEEPGAAAKPGVLDWLRNLDIKLKVGIAAGVAGAIGGAALLLRKKK